MQPSSAPRAAIRVYEEIVLAGSDGGQGLSENGDLLARSTSCACAKALDTGNSQHNLQVEIDRYLVWLSQTLGYKIGPLKIRGLRTYAENEPGEKFDLRSFHDEVLKKGVIVDLRSTM